MDAKLLGTFNEENIDYYDLIFDLWDKYQDTNEQYYAKFITREGKEIIFSTEGYSDSSLFLDSELKKLNQLSPMEKDKAKKIEFKGSLISMFDKLVEYGEDRQNVYIDYISTYPQTEGNTYRLYSADYYIRDMIEKYSEDFLDQLTKVNKEDAVKIDFNGTTLEEAFEILYDKARNGENVYIDYISTYPQTEGNTYRLYSVDYEFDLGAKKFKEMKKIINPNNETSKAEQNLIDERKQEEKNRKRAIFGGYTIEDVREIEEIRKKHTEALENGDMETADKLFEEEQKMIKEAKRKGLQQKADKWGCSVELVEKIEKLREKRNYALKLGQNELVEEIEIALSKLLEEVDKSSEESYQDNSSHTR